ncbi:MAG: PTS sugar transporter subunit IIA [Spirochaetes bacterium]|nr:PTS sugar transporter subunit IIA [Spirochaetota bacterium]
MSLLDILDEKAITVHLQELEKESVIKELLDLLVKAGKLKDKELAFHDVMEREKKGSTGLEKGIAVPHAKTAAVTALSMSIGISAEGVDFNSMDGEYSHIFFLLLAPPGASGPHVAALSNIARLVQPPLIRDKLKNAKSPGEVIDIITQYENGG